MVLKKKQINSIIYYTYFILFFLSQIQGYFKLSIFGLGSNIIFNFILLTILFVVNIKDIKKDFFSFILSIFIILLLLASFAYTNCGVGSILNLYNFIIGILVFNAIDIDRKKIKFIYAVGLFIYFRNFLLSFNIWNNYLYGVTSDNPNSVGINLFFSYILVYNFLKDKKKPVLNFLLLLVTFYGVYSTNCRSALLALFIFAVIMYFPFAKKYVYKHRTVFLWLIVIIGAVFPFIYVNMYQNNYNFVMPFTNKELYTGREHLWSPIIMELNKEKINYFIGLGSNHMTDRGLINNFHSWYLGFIFSFGIVIFTMCFIILIRKTKALNRKNIIFAILSFLIIGYVETVGLWTSTQILIYILFLIGRFETKEDNNDNSIYSDIQSKRITKKMF